MTGDRRVRAWALWKAARPSQLALILLVYVMGLGMACATVAGAGAQAAHLRSPGPVVGAAVLVPVATAVHYANEYVDVETDRMTTRTPFSGGSGALVETGVQRTVLELPMVLGAGGGLVGAGLAWRAGLLPDQALGLVVCIALTGLSYSLPPGALVRRGVGELTNALLGGVVLPLYGAATLTPLTAELALVVVPFALLVGTNLFATHWPDREADAAVGKRTLAVRWTPRRLRRAYWLLTGGAVGLTLLFAGRVLAGPVVVAQALALPFLVWGGVVLTRHPSPFPAVAAMVVYAAVTAAAWWWLALS